MRYPVLIETSPFYVIRYGNIGRYQHGHKAPTLDRVRHVWKNNGWIKATGMCSESYQWCTLRSVYKKTCVRKPYTVMWRLLEEAAWRIGEVSKACFKAQKEANISCYVGCDPLLKLLLSYTQPCTVIV